MVIGLGQRFADRPYSNLVKAFIYDQAAARVIFDVGSLARLRDELERLAAKRPIFISTPGRRHDVEQQASNLTGMTPAIHADAVMHVPIETIAAAREAATSHAADSIVSFGGGSAIDTSKAVGLELNLPVVAVPTTYGGS